MLTVADTLWATPAAGLSWIRLRNGHLVGGGGRRITVLADLRCHTRVVGGLDLVADLDLVEIAYLRAQRNVHGTLLAPQADHARGRIDGFDGGRDLLYLVRDHRFSRWLAGARSGEQRAGDDGCGEGRSCP
jgi:hypothetical protein